jgi:hypothetical protein
MYVYVCTLPCLWIYGACHVVDCILRLGLPPASVLAFNAASVFNGEVSSWDVSSVTQMNFSKWKIALPS